MPAQPIRRAAHPAAATWAAIMAAARASPTARSVAAEEEAAAALPLRPRSRRRARRHPKNNRCAALPIDRAPALCHVRRRLVANRRTRGRGWPRPLVDDWLPRREAYITHNVFDIKALASRPRPTPLVSTSGGPYPARGDDVIAAMIRFHVTRPLKSP